MSRAAGREGVAGARLRGPEIATDSPVLVFAGDRPLADPLAREWAEGEARRVGADVTRHVGGEGLDEAIADLRTASLFGAGKIHLFVESGILAQPVPPGELLEAALAGPEVDLSRPRLEEAARDAGLALLRLLRLLEVDLEGRTPEQAIAEIPETLWKGRKLARARAGAGDRAAAHRKLAALLEAARLEGLRGLAEDAAGRLADLLRDGLPERHRLVLVESRVDPEHPLAAALRVRGAWIEAGSLAFDPRKGASGFGELLDRLASETGVRLTPDAARELIRRTIRSEEEGRFAGAVDADSVGRLEAEYRKLARLGGQRELPVETVRDLVADRGEEGSFDWLDALSEGRGGEAVARMERRIAGAADPSSERLRLLAQLAGFLRQVGIVGAIARKQGLPLRVESFPRFRDRILPRLLEPVEGVERSLLAGGKPFPLFRAYQMAVALPERVVERLPGRLLTSERRLKGETAEAQLELLSLVAELARWSAPAARAERAPAARPGD